MISQSFLVYVFDDRRTSLVAHFDNVFAVFRLLYRFISIANTIFSFPHVIRHDKMTLPIIFNRTFLIGSYILPIVKNSAELPNVMPYFVSRRRSCPFIDNPLRYYQPNFKRRTGFGDRYFSTAYARKLSKN